MKRSYFLILSLFITVNLVAQITISNNDMPSANDIYHMSITTNLQGNDPVLTGINYLWDYSQLQANIQRSDTFVTVTSTPFAYQFYFNNILLYPTHKASYAIKGNDINFQVVSMTDLFDFYKNATSQYANVGFGANINGVPSSTRRIPIDVQYVFPLNYNNNNISYSEFLVSIPTIGDYGQSQERIDTVDGWGSVITPLGTFNCLRVKSILNITDTLYTSQFGIGLSFPRPQQIEYKWVAIGSGVPVLKITTAVGGSQIEYQDNLMVGINDNILPIYHFKAFPNPAKESILIDFQSLKKEQITINLKDINGKIVKQIYNGNIEKGNNHIFLSLSEFSNGIYFLEMRINNHTKTEKLIIAR
ncbi:MAG: T9SS type A sorting domain-containing protein [Flavobacteriales bacterium]|nr:T9SS type A sorting domain-containing protein [Flavobacteriales bacterium]